MKEKLLKIILFSIINFGFAQNKTNLTIGGFAKMDAMVTVFEGGKISDPESPLRDIHLPSAIPIGGKQTYDTHMHIKESRFHVAFDQLLANNKKIEAYFEMDFLLSAAGDARVSNSYNPRIRHFYINYDKWLFGQTWSTFMVVIIPDDLDFSGAAEGIVFNRQPQIRYSTHDWQFSLEVPEATFTPNNGGQFVTSSGGIPDIVIRKNFSPQWGTASLAGIYRNPRYFDDNQNRIQTNGYGITGGTKINIGKKDDLRIQTTYGNGLGRYIALAFLNSAFINDQNHLESISSINGFASYLHHWNNKLRSSLNYSFLNATNPTHQNLQKANKNAWSSSINLLYQPDKNLLFGVETMYAYRGLEDGSGDGFYRLQFSAKYSFNYKTR